MIESKEISKSTSIEKKEGFDKINPKLVVICKHCGKQIDKVKLIGLSLICPLCGMPQNGQPHAKAKIVTLKS